MTAITMDRPDGTWSITTRMIVYAAIGAALYAVFNIISFAFVMPGTQEVSVRPHYGLLTFFGFAFGPVVGFLTGLVGNIVGDHFTGWGASPRGSGASRTAWRAWLPASSAYGHPPVEHRATRLCAAVAGVVATVIGFLFIFVGLS